MIIQRSLLVLLAVSLLANLGSPIIVEVLTASAALTAKEVLKKIGVQFIDKAEDNLVDSAIGALCLAAGLKNKSDDHSIDDVWIKINQMNVDLTNRMKVLEYKQTKLLFNSFIAIKVKATYDLMINILNGTGGATTMESFKRGHDDMNPLIQLSEMLNYLQNEESTYLTPLIALDEEFGGSRELFGRIKSGVRAITNQIIAIHAFHIGFFGEKNILSWINKNFADVDLQNDDAINQITEKYIKHMGSIFPVDIKNKVQEVHTWLDDYMVKHANNNRYWERGIVDGLMKKVMDQVNEEGKTYKNLTALLAQTERLLQNITTNDVFDVIVTDELVGVLRNRSTSVKMFDQGKNRWQKKNFDVSIVIFRSKAKVELSEAQKSDIDIYGKDLTPRDRMDLIESRTDDSVQSIVAICFRTRRDPSNDHVSIVTSNIYGNKEKRPVQSWPSIRYVICVNQDVMPSYLYFSVV